MLFNPIIYIKSRKSGFTLIEVMLVLAIMALLLVIVVPAYQKATATAQINRCIESLKGIDMAKEQYALDFNINQGITPSDSDIDPYLKGGIQRATKSALRGVLFWLSLLVCFQYVLSIVVRWEVPHSVRTTLLQ